MSSPCPTPHPHTTHRFYRWELLFLLFWAYFFHQADRAIYGIVLSKIKADLELTDPQVGAVGTVLFLVLALMMPLAGYLGDIWSRKWLITGSLIFWSCATTITGCARGVLDLVMFRSVATAGGEAFYAPAACSLLAQFHQKTRALALSIHQCALYFGVITSGYIGGYIADKYGWRSAFYVFGGVGVFLGILFIFRLKDAQREVAPADACRAPRIGPMEALGVIFRTPTAALLTVGFIAIVFVNNAYMVWAPTFVETKFNMSNMDAAFHAMLWHHLAALAAILVSGWLSDRMVRVRRTFRIEVQATAMLLGAPAIAALGFVGSPAAMWVTMAAMGVFRGFYEANTQASVFDVIAPRYRASAVAMMVMLAFLIGSTSSLLMGYSTTIFSKETGLSYGFSLLSSAYLVGGLAVLAARLRTFHRDYYVEPVSPEAAE